MNRDAVDSDLEKGRRASRLGAWTDAYRALERADRQVALSADDLELLATSAYLLGQDLEYERAIERAHRAWLAADETGRAARCAFWLGLTLFFRGESGRANGWLGRAQRLIADHDCVEQGYLLLPTAEGELEGSDAGAALETAARASAIGDRFNDPDLTALARHLEGRALLRLGTVDAGLALLDETMVAVCGGELSPMATGLVYCSVIEACREVFAIDRAGEWTLALRRWCEQQTGMVAFTGTCLVHRAEVMQSRGAWSETLEEVRLACERATRGDEAQPPAAAFYRRGEIHRLRGAFEAAEKAYRDASDHGFEPQPGLALLRLAQRRADAARAMVRRMLTATDDPLRRARLLPALIEIALAAGDDDEARTASMELDEIARRFPTDVLRALAARGRGAVELTSGSAEGALVDLREAFELWTKAGLPYETARVRVLISGACRRLGDVESADLEIGAARAEFERLGAKPDLAVLDSPRASFEGRPTLTPRERQVLARVAAGKTNRAIAAELQVSERTIDRHVSNILTKLSVPSRAAATAYAYTHHLL